MVKKEKTGASGRSQMMSVRPLGSLFTVMRFSKDATSWASAKEERRRRRTAVVRFRLFIGLGFIGPPAVERAKRAYSWTDMCWTEQQGRSLKLRGGKVRCQTGAAPRAAR